MTMNSPGVCSSAAELCRTQSAPWRLWMPLHFSCARVRAAAAAHMASRSLFIVCWVSRTEGTVRVSPGLLPLHGSGRITPAAADTLSY